MILFSSVSPMEDAFRERVAEMKYAATLTKPAKSGQLLSALVRVIAPEIATAKDVPASQEATSAPEDGQFRILLVDDNTINKKVGQKILKRLGYSAVVASSGEEAIEYCQNEDFHMVLMDIEMPDMDGIAATRMIRAALPDDRVPYIVALTANAMSSERDIYLKSGMDDYLSKPIDLEALSKSIGSAKRLREERARFNGTEMPGEETNA